jgi:diguanylate cyclase (GGDEF)-like protein
VGNRDLLAERYGHALARAQRGGSPPSLLFVDLDAFKSVNDSLGYARGDELLKSVAGRLQGCVRSVETVARVGGDEFALLVEWAEGQNRSTGSATIAERVLESIAVPFEVAGRTLSMTVSIGIAHARANQAIDQLLRDGDSAMYASKACGPGGYRYFHPNLQQQGADRLERIAELRQAVADESFSVRYQPIFDLQTGQLVAAEALVRWEHPERGVVAPGDFIPLAEETGLIVPLGRSVLTEACVQAAAWNRENPHRDPLFVGVNLSPRQFADAALIEHVRAALSHSGLPPERLTLEIT